MIWKAPDITVQLAGRDLAGSCIKLEVLAARNLPVATAYLELSNLRFESQEGAKDGDSLQISWGWRGEDLSSLFTGTVLRSHLRETLQLWALCRGRALVDTRVTRTYQNETALAIVEHLIAPCRYTVSSCTMVDGGIDKLPLQANTLVEAISFLNRRLNLDHDCYCDAQGGFHWEAPDKGQQPVAHFTHGEDVESWVTLPGNRILLTVAGTPIWHSNVLSVVNRQGEEHSYFIEQVRHTVGVLASGARSQFWLTEAYHG